MSEPKRYLAKCSWTAIETQEHPMGEFVLWSDYDRLKAEVDALKAERAKFCNITHGNLVEMNKCVDENARLKAEVERLEKENALSKPRLLISSQDIKLLKDEIQHFKAEVEKLTKERDGFRDAVYRMRGTIRQLEDGKQGGQP